MNLEKYLIPAIDSFINVEDVFSVIGKGIVLTGKINGSVKNGDNIIINDKKVKIISITMHHKTVTEASNGQNVGLLISGIKDRKEVKPDKYRIL